MRKIVDGASGEAKMTKILAELKREMGHDYIAPIKLRMPPNEILIRVELQ